MQTRTNWSGTVEYAATERVEPNGSNTVRDACAAGGKWKVIGTGHAFNHSADTRGRHIATTFLDRIMSLDTEKAVVTVEAGVSYAKLAAWLEERGWALPNLASLPHISVGGAVATATHGSGDRNGNLATSVTAMRLLDGNGASIEVSRAADPELFPGVVVSLGALGMATELTLAVVPSFRIAQTVYRHMPWERYLDFFDAVHGSAYSVSAFTDWHPDHVGQVWRKALPEHPDPGPEFHGALRLDRDIHPIEGTDPVHCTPQCGVPGSWNLRLPHFLPGFTPSRGDEIQSEFFVDRQLAVDALEAVRAIGSTIRDCLWISEIRTVDADDLWMSPAYGRPVVGIHFTWKRDPERVRSAIETVEAALAPYEPVPHWGKVWVGARPAPAKESDFRRLMERFDPDGRCRNPWMETVFGPA